MLQNVDWGTVIFTIVLAFISSGIFNVIIKINFDKKLNKSNLDHEDKINTMNHDHEEEMNNLKAKLESFTFISNKQYEKEFEVYVSIWEKYIDYRTVLLDYLNEKKSSVIIMKLKECLEEYKEYLDRNMPFIDDNIFKTGNALFYYNLDYIYGKAEYKYVEEQTYLFKNAIHDYLNTLKVK